MVEGGRKEKPSAALAGTRPVFRGLRQTKAPRFGPGPQGPGLAGTRPVFRGLRREPRRRIPRFENSFMTLAGTRPVFRGLRRLHNRALHRCSPPQSCRDETRFQGIATLSGAISTEIRPLLTLAGTRPVFRGLRPECTLNGLPILPIELAGTRPVFRGLRR